MLDLGLAGGVKVVGVRGPRVDVLDDGEDVDDVLLVEEHDVLLVQRVLAKLKLKARTTVTQEPLNRELT